MQTNRAIRKCHYKKLIGSQDRLDLLFKFVATLSSPGVAQHDDKNYSHMACKQYFRVGSNVILKRNLWKESGLFNGSKGVIKNVYLNEDHTLHCLEVEFADYIGKGFNGTNNVIIEPIEINIRITLNISGEWHRQNQQML